LAHADIEKNTYAAFDRVTVYRTLQTFVEKGIIHQIPTTDNSILYALCRHNCEQGHHHDNHVHFICTNCDKTFCLDDVTVPDEKLPPGQPVPLAGTQCTAVRLGCAALMLHRCITTEKDVIGFGASSKKYKLKLGPSSLQLIHLLRVCVASLTGRIALTPTCL
jgi:hypothetical protein